MPLVVAIVLDAIVQYLLFGWIRVSGAITTGIAVMGLPYVIARAVTSWIVFGRTAQPPGQPPLDIEGTKRTSLK